MNEEEISLKIKECLVSMNVDVSDPEKDLVLSGELDSVNIVELIMFIEESFGSKIGDFDIDVEDLRTLSSITQFVVSQTQS